MDATLINHRFRLLTLTTNKPEMLDASSFWLDAWSTTVCAFAVIALVSVTSAYGRNWKKRTELYPPMAPMSMLETIRSIASESFPFIIAENAKTLNSSTYRLPVSVPGAPIVAVVGDTTLVRESLKDSTTTKPTMLMYTLNLIMCGKPCIVTSNGDAWHHRRRPLSAAFASQHIQRMSNSAKDKTQAWVRDRLELALVDGQASFDIANELVDITLSTISETAFHYNISAEEKAMFRESLELTMKEFYARSIVNPLRMVFGWFLRERRQAFGAARNLNGIAKNIMENYRKLTSQDNGQDAVSGSVIERIMTNTKAYKDDDERAADITVLMIAGHDTTAYTIAWTLIELAKNPSMQAKLRESVLNEQNWGNSKELRWVVRESMRLHPVVAMGIFRQAGRDFWTTSSSATQDSKKRHLLPKGSILFHSTIILMKNPEVFERPEEFNPYRWENPTKEMNDSFMPFGLGKQNCVGQSLANAEIQTLIPLLCSKYHIELEYEGPTEFFMTLKSVGTRLKFIKR